MSRILIIDDEASIRLMLKESLKDYGYEAYTAKNSEEAFVKNEEHLPDVIILDLKLGNENGLDLIKELKSYNPNGQIIILTAYGDIKTAVEAVKKGVYDFVNKPFDIDELILIIEKSLDLKTLKNKVYLLEKEKQYNKINFIGSSRLMEELQNNLFKVSQMDDVTVLIRGDSGTGKELAAEYVFRNSSRENKPYIKINCAAMPESLVESELFGHIKGAFTGASQDKIGLIEAASGGTIFLDEIGEISTDIQAKLLRVIEYKKLKRVGGINEIPIDVRIIAATNKNLESAIEKGEFREDLYYRLNVFPVHLPPLRDRSDDLVELIHHFVEIYSEKFNKSISVSNGFIREARKYDWPGNIRELKNVIERLCILSDDKILLESDFHTFKQSESFTRPRVNEEMSFDSFNLEDEMSRIELGYINEALKQSEGNVSKAADLLNITRYTLMRRMNKYQI